MFSFTLSHHCERSRFTSKIYLPLLLWWSFLFGIFTTSAVDTTIHHQQHDSEEIVCEIDAVTGNQICRGKTVIFSDSVSATDTVKKSVDETNTSSDDVNKVKEQPTSIAESSESSSECLDQHVDCKFWSSLGECDKNPGYMLNSCAMSCQSCINELLINETTLYGERQLTNNNNPDTVYRFKRMHEYMIHTVFVNETFANVKSGVSILNFPLLAYFFHPKYDSLLTVSAPL
jgi:ShK domain-like